jgi:hypothetical protein
MIRPTPQRISPAVKVALLTLAIIALSGCIRIQPYSQGFAPQVVTSGTITSGTIGPQTEPAAAIPDTLCADDFADVFPADSIFDDRLLADWGDKDDACDPWPQNDREF